MKVGHVLLPRHFAYSVCRTKGGPVLRIGKGHVVGPISDSAVLSYAERRYPKDEWGQWGYVWYEPASGEDDAYAREARLMKEYEGAHGGQVPPWNEARAGGGRRME